MPSSNRGNDKNFRGSRAKAVGAQRSIHKCNFRAAGRLSNDDARLLGRIHEAFARHFAAALDSHLGIAIEIKLDSVDQVSTEEYLAQVSALSYLVPFASQTLILELDNDLVFPIVELLMGGRGDTSSPARELSEIEEEIMQEIASLAGKQCEVAWGIQKLFLVPGPQIKPSAVPEFLSGIEKVTLLKFRTQIADVSGFFRLAIPTEILKGLIKQTRLDRPQKSAGVWRMPSVPLRERVLDCEMEVTVELQGLKVSVRDLIALQPGSVLKLRAPIRIPGTLTLGGRVLFEAVPVRNGSQRAAQLGRRISATEWKRK